MSTQNLDALFQPRSVALIGATPEPEGVAGTLSRALAEAGYVGDLYFVNRNHSIVGGITCYADINELPATPELAIVATSARRFLSTAEKLADLGCKTVAFIAAPDGLGRSRARRLTEGLKAIQQRTGMRILGPNCHGIALPNLNLQASFAAVTALPGKLAFMSQSGGVATSVLDWATAQQIGFSAIVALGDQLDIDESDTLDYLAQDTNTSAILLYLVNLKSARRFLSALRAAARSKPVVVFTGGLSSQQAVELGSSRQGNHGFSGHSAALSAAIRRCGALQVNTLAELFDAASTLTMAWPVPGDGLALLANGHGLCAIAEDALHTEGGRLAELSNTTKLGLRRLAKAGSTQLHQANLGHAADGSTYASAISLLKADPAVDGILVLHTPSAFKSATSIAQAVIDASKTDRALPILTNWLGETSARDARERLLSAGIPTYSTPNRAVRGFSHLVHYRQAQAMLREAPPTDSLGKKADVTAAARLIEQQQDNEEIWPADSSLALLQSYAIPVADYRSASSPAEFETAANLVRGPWILKALSSKNTEKTANKALRFPVQNLADLKMQLRLLKRDLADGFSDESQPRFMVQQMISPLNSIDLNINASMDSIFGMTINLHTVCGSEIVAYPPLNRNLALDVLRQLPSSHQAVLNAHNQALFADLLCNVSQLLIEQTNIQQLALDPLRIHSKGITVLDAKVRTATPNPQQLRFAIRPYPSSLVETLDLQDGRQLCLRPMRPDDEIAFREWFSSIPTADIYKRFFHVISNLSPELAARFVQIDYDREIALVLVEDNGRMVGEIRLVAETDHPRAQFAILLTPEYRGYGLGARLIQRCLRIARHEQIEEVYGEVLASNTAMLALCKKLGFKQNDNHTETGIVTVHYPIAKNP